MTNSMTGFGKSKSGLSSFSVDIKSVNHRFLDISVKMPKQLYVVEDKIKDFLSSKISRGKVDVYISVENAIQDDLVINVNEKYIEQYFNAYRQISELSGIKFDITLSDIASHHEVFSLESSEKSNEELWNEVFPALDDAASSFLASRNVEGEKLKKDILSKIDFINKEVEFIETLYPENIKIYQDKLIGKIKDAVCDYDVEPQRVLTEVAIMADKLAIDEEITRLKSHIDLIRNTFELSEPIGRKLDFIIQEVNREINTIASKSQNIEISNSVIEVKTTIEKIREQIQNVE